MPSVVPRTKTISFDRRCAEERLHFLAGLFVGVRRPGRERMCAAMDVRIVVLVKVRERVDHALRLLRGGRVVHPGQRLAVHLLPQNRKVLANRRHIERPRRRRFAHVLQRHAAVDRCCCDVSTHDSRPGTCVCRICATNAEIPADESEGTGGFAAKPGAAVPSGSRGRECLRRALRLETPGEGQCANCGGATLRSAETARCTVWVPDEATTAGIKWRRPCGIETGETGTLPACCVAAFPRTRASTASQVTLPPKLGTPSVCGFSL